MAQAVKIDQLDVAVMEELTGYAAGLSDVTKQAVNDAGQAAVDYIKENAPKRTGKYAKSFKVKKMSENADGLQVVVYSPTRYPLPAHSSAGKGSCEARRRESGS